MIHDRDADRAIIRERVCPAQILGDDLEPPNPRRDCPWKCAPNNPSCLCIAEQAQAQNGGRSGTD